MKTTIAVLLGALIGSAITWTVHAQAARLSDPISKPTPEEVYRAIDGLKVEVDQLKKDVTSLDIRVSTLNRVIDRELARQRP